MNIRIVAIILAALNYCTRIDNERSAWDRPSGATYSYATTVKTSFVGRQLSGWRELTYLQQ